MKTSVTTISTIRDTITRISQHQKFTADEKWEATRILTEHECWVPLFQLLNDSLSGDKKRDLEVFLYKIKIEIKYLSDHSLATKRAQEIVEKFKVDFSWFRLEILSMDEGNWHLEADILIAVRTKFAVINDRVKCLERICSIYEKKIPDEELLQKYYHDLIALDPKNIKALKYFKMLHSQNYDWDLVIGVLKKIIAHANRLETYRSAQELAVVYLYSKDEPLKALRIMNKHCAQSPLDKSTILYDIHARLGDWAACITLTREKLVNETQVEKQAQLHYKIAKLEEKRGRNDLAVHEYEMALDKDDGLVDALQAIIAFHLQREDWREVLVWLERLRRKVTDRSQVARIQNLIDTVRRKR